MGWVKTGVDANQKDIVKGLKALGWSVQVLNQVGDGCPDIMVGARGMNILLEIKDPAQPPSQRKLRPKQETWHAGWKGQVGVVLTLEGAVTVVESWLDEECRK